MTALFLKIVNMSISASWLVLAVLLVRLFLRKGPKWVSVLLWGIVAVRLVCPFTIESPLSLIPSGETIPMGIELDTSPAIDSGLQSVDGLINPMIVGSNTPMPGASINPLQITLGLYSGVWLLGAAALLLYTVVSTLRLRRTVATAVRYEGNIFQSEFIDSPFVFGVIRPRIYLPYGIDGESRGHIIAHERAHIRRRDHWWKPMGFLLLAVHWFNPVMWLAYIMLCRDIELACDEAVVGDLQPAQRADYSEALLRCSMSHRSVMACPVAFGEVGVKQRVRSVLTYRKPALWVLAVSVLLCGVLAVCFLTDPERAGHPANGCYLTIREEGIVAIEVTAPTHSGGVTNANGKPFKVGETVWLEPLDPFEALNDLRGVTVLAMDAHGKTVYALSFDEQASYHEIQSQLQSSWLVSYCDAAAPMTMEDVISLSERGYALTWGDVESYAYTETGSGLMIWRFDIDEMFCLMVGGSVDINSMPMYMYLTAHDGSNDRIDIRDGGVAAFVEAHKDNPVVTACTAGWKESPVGHDTDAYGTMLEEYGYPQGMYWDRVKLMPLVIIQSTDELNAFMQNMDSVMDFDATYGDVSSFRDNAAIWNDDFFSGNTLYMVYLLEPTTGYRHTVEFVNYSQGELLIGVQTIAPEVGDDVVEGWILAVGVPKAQITGVDTVQAVLSSVRSGDEIAIPN